MSASLKRLLCSVTPQRRHPPSLCSACDAFGTAMVFYFFLCLLCHAIVHEEVFLAFSALKIFLILAEDNSFLPLLGLLNSPAFCN